MQQIAGVLLDGDVPPTRYNFVQVLCGRFKERISQEDDKSKWRREKNPKEESKIRWQNIENEEEDSWVWTKEASGNIEE